MNAATFNSSSFTLRAAGAASDVPASISVSGASALLTPSARLAGSTTYTVTIAGTVSDTSGATLVTPATWTFTTAAPAIIARFPAAGATGVNLSGVVVNVTFDRAMNPATFNSSSFTLRAAGAASDVPASISASGASASLTPSAPLAGSTTYTVTIAGTVAGTDGSALGTPATWTFTTRGISGQSFVYVANEGGSYGSNNVSAYAIDAATGALTAVAGSPFAAGSSPVSVTVDPTGKFAYVASDGVRAYTINAATGALTAVAGSPFAAGIGPSSVTVDATGKFAYVANYGSNDVSAYTINAATGALTAVVGSPFTAGGQPQSITVDPTGKFAYVANQASNNVSAYTINAATGALTAVAGSPFAAGSYPRSVTADPTGKFAYVANFTNGVGGNVSAYKIDAVTGALTPVAGSPFAAGFLPDSVTVDPTGKFAYVANNGGGVGGGYVSAYTIDAMTGALTEVAEVFAGGERSFSVVTATPVTGTTPALSKAFSPATIPATISVGASTTLSFTINNPSLTAASGASFTDPLPCGLLVASPNGLSGSCGGGIITAPPGTSTVSLGGGGIPAQSFCTFSVNLVSNGSAGTCVNTTSSLVTNEFGTGQPASAALLQLLRPVIVSRFPAAGATGVDPSAVVNVTFDRPMNFATLFPCQRCGPGPSFTLQAAGAASNVAASISVLSATSVSLIPSAPLAGSTTYTVTIAGVGDTHGIAIVSPITWTFTTAPSAPPPVIISRFPAAGANGATASQIDVTFDRAMRAATLNSSSFTLRAGGSTSNVPGLIYVSGAAASLVLSAPLMPLTVYTVTIAGTVTDTNGVALGSPATWTFTTGGNSGPPAIISRLPAAGATGVVTSSEVDVTFDREMNAATFNSSTFTLRAAGAASNVSAQIIVFASRVSLVPFAPLAASTTYTVTIAGTVTDANGVALGTPVTWTFTTGTTTSPE